jgi:hypothetical protein
VTQVFGRGRGKLHSPRVLAITGTATMFWCGTGGFCRHHAKPHGARPGPPDWVSCCRRWLAQYPGWCPLWGTSCLRSSGASVNLQWTSTPFHAQACYRDLGSRPLEAGRSDFR